MKYFLTSVLFILSCQSVNNQSSTNALVSPSQFAHSYELIANLKNYVPFKNPSTCFARALYMSLALATEKIPSSAYFVFPQNPQDRLHGPGGLEWQYHVAMMIRANDSHEQMIFDPSFSESPMVDHKWISMFAQVPTKNIILPGSTFAMLSIGNQTANLEAINSFEELPKFKQTDIESACGVIEQFQSQIENVDLQVARQMLHAETIRFTKRMDELEKLDWGNLPSNVIYCGSKKIL